MAKILQHGSKARAKKLKPHSQSWHWYWCPDFVENFKLIYIYIFEIILFLNYLAKRHINNKRISNQFL